MSSEMVIQGDYNSPLLGQYLDPNNDYPPGQFNPVFFTTGDGVSRYRQPPSNANRSQLNVQLDGARQDDGELLDLNRLRRSPRSTTRRRNQISRLNFKVTAPDVRSGETFEMIWNFGNGTSTKPVTLVSGQVATTAYSYKTAGVYTATVTVSGNEGSSGSAKILDIKVGSKAGTKGPGTSHPHKHKPPVSGSPHKQKTHSNPGTGAGNTSSTQPTTSAPTTTTPPVTPPVHKTLPKDPSLPGVAVTGVLLSAPVTEIAQAAAPSAAQGDGGTTSTSTGGGVPGAVGGIGLAVLLLVGGFLTEGLPAARWR